MSQELGEFNGYAISFVHRDIGGVELLREIALKRVPVRLKLRERGERAWHLGICGQSGTFYP